MQKFGAYSLFLMSILLAGTITPATNGFQIVGITPTYFGAAFGQTNQTDDINNQTGTGDEEVITTIINKLEIRAAAGEGITEVEVELEFVTPKTDLEEISSETVDLFSMDRETVDNELVITFSDNETSTESSIITDEEINVQVDGDETSAEVEVELKFTIESIDLETIKDAIIQETQLDLTMVSGLIGLEFSLGDEIPDDADDVIIDDSEIQNMGQLISDFVHDARDQFKSQKNETKAIIESCREAIRNAAPEERQAVREQCREDLNEVRESYQQLRRTYHDTFREFRDNVRILIQDARGASISESTVAAAVDAINMRAQRDEARDRMHEIRMQIREEFREEVEGIREQMREEREQMREEMQRIRESQDEDSREELRMLREEMKEERERLREQMQEERERIREQMQQERENMREEMQKMREQMQEERNASRDAEDEVEGEELEEDFEDEESEEETEEVEEEQS